MTTSSDDIISSSHELLFGDVFKNKASGLSVHHSEQLNNSELNEILKKTLKAMVSENINKIYFCPQCALLAGEQPYNQLGNDCLSTTPEMRYMIYLMEGLLLISPTALTAKYVESGQVLIPKSFLKTIKANDLINSVI